MKRARELSGLTQMEVAQRAKIDRAKLSEAESGYIFLGDAETEAVRRVVFPALRQRKAEIEKILKEK
jgi:transcriptional regulator with XRE-family HTH domain